MTGRVNGKIAVITGSTSGCGRACAIRFAAEGARVMVTGRNAQAGDEIVTAIRDAGGIARFHRADVGIESDVAGLVAATVDAFGGIDILVNNAAPTDLARGPERADNQVTELSTEQLETIWRPALYGYFWACRYGIREMIRQGRGGSIVNVSSATTIQPLSGMDAYIAAKGAMNSTTRSFATEYGQYGIRVNNVMLGLIVTSDISQAVLDDPVLGPRVMAHHLTRAGRPDDMTNAALFLASDEAEFVTGSTLIVDGGLTANSPLNAPFSRKD